MQCEEAMHRGQQRWTYPQGMQLPPLGRAKPAPMCGESIWVFLPAEKAKQSAKRSFFAADKTSTLPRWRQSEGQWQQADITTAKGVQGWLFARREKSDSTVSGAGFSRGWS